MRIYLASSWRNELYPEVLKQLREAGHDVYDFRNPVPGDHGFSWSEIDPNWSQWTPEQFKEALKDPASERGFKHDMDALMSCHACVLLLPCGKSAHLELGWAAGNGCLTIILQMNDDVPELMYKMCNKLAHSVEEVIEYLAMPVTVHGGKVITRPEDKV